MAEPSLQPDESQTAKSWFERGEELERVGRKGEALDAYRRSLKINPRVAAPWVGLARLLVANQQQAEACECLHHGVTAEPQNTTVRTMYARALAANGRLAQAEVEYRRVLRTVPGHPGALFGLGGVLEDLGKPRDAADAYRACLTGAGDSAPALGALLAIGGQTDVTDAIAIAEDRLLTVDDSARAPIAFGLGKELERRGSIDAAFAAYTTANAARRRIAGAFDRERFDHLVDKLIDIFSPAFFAERADWGDGTAQPVFIVGMPRSGTTLTEHVLASHPACHGAGELDALSDIATGAPDRLGRADAVWPDCAPELSASQIASLAADYLARLRTSAPQDALRIIDKAPLNLFHVGLLAVAFPRARVIHCTRNILDNGLSIFAENFAPEQRWATDLDDIAWYWRGCERLMAHWRAAAPTSMLVHPYEAMIGDTDTAVRRLLEFVGLPWDASCLAFHENLRAVQTPSRWQVRRPLYSTSVGRWQRFASHLAPLRRAAAEYGEACPT